MKKFAYTTDPALIPSKKIVHVAGDRAGRVCYACPDSCWREHFDAWCALRRAGDTSAPEPFPWGHCMFAKPLSYGAVPYGCTDQEMIRKAHETDVRAMLHGWDRDLTPERLDAIVKATVDARMSGQDVGASPFLACICSNL